MGVAVMVVDDQARFRELVREMVDPLPGFEIVSECSSGEESLQELDTAAPELVLMDVRMPGMGGLEATRRIKALRPEIAVILISAEDPHTHLLESVRDCGAAAFLPKQHLRAESIADLWSRHRPLVESPSSGEVNTGPLH